MEYSSIKPNKAFYLLGLIVLVFGAVMVINQFQTIMNITSVKNNLQTDTPKVIEMEKGTKLLIASIANKNDTSITYDSSVITVEYYNQTTTIDYSSLNNNIEIELMSENVSVDIDSYSGLFYIKAIEDDTVTISTNANNNYYKAINNFDSEVLILFILKLIGGFFLLTIGLVVELLTLIIRKSNKKKMLEKPNYY
ncbi:hypothetical protein CI105_05845 [Candidatus Izimaplasma bacterium ZiA1]|uniref:hypothetical protein n=1 Tax=Candidatus Izimoplasma sp. ZiA1 TaxID=2024899 RepID=UPI000BAA636C|nr:hypothetical protein CI105_05845 [Candidatus Izimaplasma bacterium ZiA1]